MKTLFILLILFIFSTVAGFAQTETDLERYGLKGSVKKIESYEIDFWGPEDDRSRGTRNMSNITNFDRTGNILESISFTNDGNGSYYEKYVYNYDSNGKKSSVVKYTSSKGKPDEFFESELTPNWYFNLILRLKESLSTRTFYKYDKKNRLIEESQVNATGEIIEKKVFDYNEDGKNTRFAIYNGENVLTLEILTNYKNRGRITESIRFEKGIEVNKFVQYFDEKGRIIKEEQFVLKPSTNLSNVDQAILNNCSTNIFNGDNREVEWIFFDESGNPKSKLIIIDKNDDEITRDSYEHQTPSEDDSNLNAKPEWRLTGREFSNYEYDKQGNWIKSTRFRQENLAKPAFPTSINERDIAYY